MARQWINSGRCINSGATQGLLSVCPTSRAKTSTSLVPLLNVDVTRWAPCQPSFQGHLYTLGKMSTTGCTCRRSLKQPWQQRSSHQYLSWPLTWLGRARVLLDIGIGLRVRLRAKATR